MRHMHACKAGPQGIHRHTFGTVHTYILHCVCIYIHTSNTHTSLSNCSSTKLKSGQDVGNPSPAGHASSSSSLPSWLSPIAGSCLRPVYSFGGMADRTDADAAADPSRRSPRIIPDARALKTGLRRQTALEPRRRVQARHVNAERRTIAPSPRDGAGRGGGCDGEVRLSCPRVLRTRLLPLPSH